MSDRSGLSRGDRNRNARLARLRQLLPPENAIVGIDLADDKQAALVTDHDSRAIARRPPDLACWSALDIDERRNWCGRSKHSPLARTKMVNSSCDG